MFASRLCTQSVDIGSVHERALNSFHTHVTIPNNRSKNIKQLFKRQLRFERGGVAFCASSAVQPASDVADQFASGERSVKLICTDVDGTLMNSRNQLSPAVEQALNSAHQAGVPVSAGVPNQTSSCSTPRFINIAASSFSKAGVHSCSCLQPANAAFAVQQMYAGRCFE